MANSSNVYGTAQPLQGNVSDWMQGQERMDFAKRQEDRQIAEIEQARKDKEKAKQDRLTEKLLANIPKNYNTGSSSLNQFQSGIILQGVNRLGEITKELRKPNLTDEERIALEIETQNIKNLPDNLMIATDNFSAIIKDYQEGVEKGSYFRNPDFEKKVLNGFDNYVGALDNGLPVVGFIDKDGDGKMDVMPYENLQQGIGVWEFQKQYDLDKMAQVAGEKLGTSETQTDRNFTKRIVKGPNLDALNSVTETIILNPDGSPTAAALSELRKRGLQPDKAGIEQVKKIFKERVLAYTDRSDKTDVDYSAQTSRMAEGRQAKKDDKVSWGVVETPPLYKAQGFKTADGYKAIGVSGKTVLPELTPPDGKTLTNAGIQSYTVGRNAKGERYIIAEIVYQDTKSSKAKTGDLNDVLNQDSATIGAQNKSKVVALTDKDARIFAEQLGFKDTNEMKDAARAVSGDQEDRRPSASNYGL